jgi:hypothetical protein
MGKEKAKKQEQYGARLKFKDGIDVEIGEQLENTRSKLIFLADCVADSNLELSEEGMSGLYWTLYDLAQDIEKAISA